MRRLRLLLGTLLVAAACTSANAETTTTPAGGDVAGTAAEVTETPPTVEETTPPTSETSLPGSGRPMAPDFTLELGDGGTFTLAEGARPVYLVFWAEWCPTCRRMLPVIDGLAAEYGSEVDFVAPAWKSSFELTQQRAAQLFQSGEIQWGLDEGEEIFQLYGVPYQPVTVLISADRTVVDAWDGIRVEEQIRTALDDLIALSTD